MAPHQPFKFQSIGDLRIKIDEIGLSIKLSENISVLSEKVKIGNFTLPNRLAIHPMEGCDGSNNGSPSELTFRRYERFGKSGVGLAWYEATAVEAKGRANPRQLMLNEANKQEFQKLIQRYEISENSLQGKHPAFGKALKILQITHSGRYSRPDSKYPQRMYPYDPLDKAYHQSSTDGTVLTDEYLEDLIEKYDETTRLAKEIGFDGVDIKACHRYLICESFSAFTRNNSQYGGPTLEQRTRLFSQIYNRLSSKYASKDFLITTRMNIHDAIPFPYGWGVEKKESANAESFTSTDPLPKPDLTEPIIFIKQLYDRGLRLLNMSIANPYFNAFVSRPFDVPALGAKIPNEHPLEGVARFLYITRELKRSLPPDLKIIGTGYTWLRQYAPFVAAAEINKNAVDVVGFGRMAFANPEFGQQILLNGEIDSKKSCIACSKCTDLMRMDSKTGCVVRDSHIYMPLYKEAKNKQN
jgi:2,4-dienoyl-CoA reductase-like NADH-dependent reductase (Old Yellow Enzyme family)